MRALHDLPATSSTIWMIYDSGYIKTAHALLPSAIKTHFNWGCVPPDMSVPITMRDALKIGYRPGPRPTTVDCPGCRKIK